MPSYESLPYRPCVGVMVLNGAGRVFVGRRIDRGEDPWPAARRELLEETNIRSVEKIAEIKEWLSYDIPRDIVGQAWKGKYRGQTQKWFAVRFTGDEDEIDLAHPAGGHKPEFSAWRWERMERVAELKSEEHTSELQA